MSLKWWKNETDTESGIWGRHKYLGAGERERDIYRHGDEKARVLMCPQSKAAYRKNFQTVKKIYQPSNVKNIIKC